MEHKNITHIVGKEQFDTEILKRVQEDKKPVLIDFWADWCPPCVAIAPIMEELADKLESNLRVAKVDVDQEPNQALSAEYQTFSIPTLMVVAPGETEPQIHRTVGFRPMPYMLQWLDEVGVDISPMVEDKTKVAA